MESAEDFATKSTVNIISPHNFANCMGKFATTVQKPQTLKTPSSWIRTSEGILRRNDDILLEMEKHDDIVGESAVSELENEKLDGSASANFFGIAEDACLLPQVLDTSARSEDDTKQNNVLAVATAEAANDLNHTDETTSPSIAIGNLLNMEDRRFSCFGDADAMVRDDDLVFPTQDNMETGPQVFDIFTPDGAGRDGEEFPEEFSIFTPRGDEFSSMDAADEFGEYWSSMNFATARQLVHMEKSAREHDPVRRSAHIALPLDGEDHCHSGKDCANIATTLEIGATKDGMEVEQKMLVIRIADLCNGYCSSRDPGGLSGSSELLKKYSKLEVEEVMAEFNGVEDQSMTGHGITTTSPPSAYQVLSVADEGHHTVASRIADRGLQVRGPGHVPHQCWDDKDAVKMQQQAISISGREMLWQESSCGGACALKDVQPLGSMWKDTKSRSCSRDAHSSMQMLATTPAGSYIAQSGDSMPFRNVNLEMEVCKTAEL